MISTRTCTDRGVRDAPQRKVTLRIIPCPVLSHSRLLSVQEHVHRGGSPRRITSISKLLPAPSLVLALLLVHRFPASSVTAGRLFALELATARIGLGSRVSFLVGISRALWCGSATGLGSLAVVRC